MKNHVLGIDIAKKKFDVVLLVDKTKLTNSFDNNKSGFRGLLNWLKKQKIDQVHACMEATGTYGDELAEFLHEKGHFVYQINPFRIKAYADSRQVRTKNDKLDALLIAQFCQTQEDLTLFQPLSEHEKKLKFLARRLEDLQDDLVREKNRIQTETIPSDVKASCKRQIAFLIKEIQLIESRINDQIDQDPDLKKKRDLLESIKGIGPASSRLFLVEFRSFQFFENVSQAAAYSGLTPFSRQSGTSLKSPGKICRMGRNRIRQILYMAAVSSVRNNPNLKAIYSNG
jgi:transposase